MQALNVPHLQVVRDDEHEIERVQLVLPLHQIAGLAVAGVIVLAFGISDGPWSAAAIALALKVLFFR